jgi:hypothetical protein
MAPPPLNALIAAEMRGIVEGLSLLGSRPSAVADYPLYEAPRRRLHGV